MIKETVSDLQLLGFHADTGQIREDDLLCLQGLHRSLLFVFLNFNSRRRMFVVAANNLQKEDHVRQQRDEQLIVSLSSPPSVHLIFLFLLLFCFSMCDTSLQGHHANNNNNNNLESSNIKGLRFDLDREAMRRNDHIYSAGCAGRKREDFNQMQWNCFFFYSLWPGKNKYLEKWKKQPTYCMEFQYSVFSTTLLLPYIRLKSMNIFGMFYIYLFIYSVWSTCTIILHYESHSVHWKKDNRNIWNTSL